MRLFSKATVAAATFATVAALSSAAQAATLRFNIDTFVEYAQPTVSDLMDLGTSIQISGTFNTDDLVKRPNGSGLVAYGDLSISGGIFDGSTSMGRFLTLSNDLTNSTTGSGAPYDLFRVGFDITDLPAAVSDRFDAVWLNVFLPIVFDTFDDDDFSDLDEVLTFDYESEASGRSPIIRLMFINSQDSSADGNIALSADEAITTLAPVPLPAAGLMLIVALGGLAGMRRYR